MSAVSILNDVLGPIMRGPSSSHTAAPFRIGWLARHLLAGEPASARISFDPGGSFGQVFREQGSDRAFAAGLMDWPITDSRFPHALELAPAHGLEISFCVEPLSRPDHPNRVVLELASRTGAELQLRAKSIGGGAIVIDELQGWPLQLKGDAHHLLVVCYSAAASGVQHLLDSAVAQLAALPVATRGSLRLLQFTRVRPWPPDLLRQLDRMAGVEHVWTAPPLVHVQCAAPPFSSASELLTQANGRSLGQMALVYESALLDLSSSEILSETAHRWQVMHAAVQSGLAEELPPMQLLEQSAGRIYLAEAEGMLPHGGAHTRAAARALAVMHVNGCSGVVCAAPTAGAAGTVPGVLVTLVEDMGLNQHQALLALLAASGIGLIIGTRATFAAEVAGCQVEIGAAGAMAAAAVVEAAGGTARQACDAAAISLQNTMGSVCDLVQGIVEIPCHTRNAVAASSAFVCADLIMGGYTNPIPLDETIDAMYAVGKMLPRELKVTALGGLACAPSAQTLPRLR